MRLLHLIAFTSEMEPMKEFYREGMGLSIGHESPSWIQFESDGASLALGAAQPGQKREIEICFATEDIDATVRALHTRGVEFIDAIRDQPFGKVIHFRDPEGTLLSLLQPARGGSVAAGGRGSSPGLEDLDVARGVPRAPVGAELGPAPSGSRLAVAVSLATEAPRLTTAIVNVRDMALAKAFYRDRLGLHLTLDSPWWVAFDAGGTSLALHPRAERAGKERHHGQGVTVGFAVAELIDWVDEARTRGLHFTTAPVDEGYGLFADITDPEGNEITFREPPPPPALEEQLAEEFEDEEIPQHVAIRKPVKKGARAVSFVAVKPEYHSGAAPKKAARAKTGKSAKRKVTAASTRGAGPAGSRLKPKRTADPQRARGKSAVGRLKKAERRTLAQKKVAVAVASKGKPVKRAAAARGKKKR